MGILTPLYSLLLLLTLPVIALYFLKPKSEKKIIASSFLWQKTIDSVNLQKLDKRLIKNWLLYLQLATLILGALFLMEPYISQMLVESKDAVIIIDVSATMAASVEDKSRLEVAKEAAVDLVQSMKGQSNLAVYTLGRDLELLYKGNNKTKSIQSIEAIDQEEGGLNQQSLDVFIQGHRASAEVSELFIFSDVPLSEEAHVQHYLSTAGINSISIDQVSHRRGASEDFLQVMISNQQALPQEGEIIVYGNDELLTIKALSLSPQVRDTVMITVEGHYDGYRIEWRGEDDYLLDNSYYFAVGQVTTKRILLTGADNRFLEEALMILPNVEVYKTELLQGIEGYDLYVFNGVLPEILPSNGSLLIIDPKRDAEYLKLGQVFNKGTMSFVKEDPLWRHVKLDFNVRQVQGIESVIGPEVMTIDGHSIVAKGQIDNHPAVVLGFDLLASDFPIRIGFPVFMHNTANYLLGQLNRVQTNSEVGQLVTIYGDPRADKRSIESEFEHYDLEDKALIEFNPSKSGFYLMTEFDGVQELKSSLLAANVPRVIKTEKEISGHAQPSVMTVDQLGHHSLKWLVLAVLLICLCIEWWVFNNEY